MTRERREGRGLIGIDVAESACEFTGHKIATPDLPERDRAMRSLVAHQAGEGDEPDGSVRAPGASLGHPGQHSITDGIGDRGSGISEDDSPGSLE